ncbi:MAG TPA: hypothetical protein VGN69_02395 [Solirubrobacteraceae bacterium]|nr:hypothetical protein [Solirubrobacteraceae bacterium]
MLTAVILAVVLLGMGAAVSRLRARSRRTFERLQVVPYRTDEANAEALVTMFEALHKRLLVRWWVRLRQGQPSLSLEAHLDASGPGPPRARLAVVCPVGQEAAIASALRSAYPHLRLRREPRRPGRPPCLLRLKKRRGFVTRLHVPSSHGPTEAFMDRLLTTMAAGGGSALVQLALTPAPAVLDRWSEHLFRQREASGVSQEPGRPSLPTHSQLHHSELRSALEIQHRALFFGDLRVVGSTRESVERIAGEMCTQAAENRLVSRGTGLRQGLGSLYARRLARGEGNPVPDLRRGVFASTELAALWQLPSPGFTAVPLERHPLPLAPASPLIARAKRDQGLLVDEHGPVTIEPELRRQNTAVPGTVEQGKTSYLLATVRDDLTREGCAVLVLDPKGDAADAAIGLVPIGRTCTVLDLARPSCGFNPLAVSAPPDAIADGVVAALRGLFADRNVFMSIAQADDETQARCACLREARWSRQVGTR